MSAGNPEATVRRYVVVRADYGKLGYRPPQTLDSPLPSQENVVS
jgi:hypothetical protein